MTASAIEVVRFLIEVAPMNKGHVRNALVALGLVSGISLTSTVISCGRENVSEVQTLEVPSMSFQSWCSSYKLQNCDVKPDNNIPTDQWQAGVNVFADLMDSLTSINLSRADFDRKTVQDLFSTFGANSTLSFVSKIPWDNLSKDDNSLVLRNKTNDAVAVFNGLRLIGSQVVTARFIGPQLVGIKGLKLADSLGGQVSSVHHLDLSKPSRITIVTDYERITDIPVQFFQVPGYKQPATLTPSSGFTAIANVVLEPGFDWRRNFNILLKGNSVRSVYSRIANFIPEGPADATTKKVIENTNTLLVGGAASNILLSMQMGKPLKCTLKVSHVPILGNVNFDIDFLSGFGLSDLVRVKSDGVKTNVYGVTTSLGRIESIEVDAKQLNLKLGMLTIPIEFKPSGPNARGPKIDDVLCR